EPDRAVGADDDVVRAVQLLALEVRGQDGDGAVRLPASDAARLCLADEQAPALVAGQPVCHLARAAPLAHAAGVVVGADHVAGDVAEQEVAASRLRPDRPLGEVEAAREALQLRVRIDELHEPLVADLDRHTRRKFGRTTSSTCSKNTST